MLPDSALLSHTYPAARRPSLRLAAMILTMVFVCFSISPGRSQTGSAEAESSHPYIHSLKITGNKAIKSKVLYNEMLIPRPAIFWWKSPPLFQAAELANDIDRLKSLYRRFGFYHTEITPEVTDYRGEVDILLRIKEGPWIRVSQVSLSMVGQPGQQLEVQELLKKGPLQVGERFFEKNFDSLKKEILNYLLDRGYPKARAEGEVLLDTKANTAAVYVQVWPGPLCSFGPITIKGQQKTPEALIRRALTITSGEPFSLAKIIASQEKLYELDLFRSVSVTPQEVPGEQTEIPITVEVTEKKQRSFKLGAGYGSWDQFRARSIFRYRNFGGGGRILEMSAKYSRLDNRFEGSFLNPMIFGSDLDLVFNTGFLRRYFPSFSDKAFYTRTLLQKELDDRTKVYIGHGLEFARPFNITDLALQLIPTQPGKLYSTDMLLWGLTRDTVDNPADPQKGNQIFLVGEWAPKLISPQLQFVQSSLEVRQYQNLGPKNVVLAGRVKFGVIPPIDNTNDIPIYRRFFAGGPTSMRAYRIYYLGPRDLAGNPIGGESLFLGNAEFRFPIYQELRGVTFFDAGNVFYKVKNTDLGQLKYGAGFGLRYQTPIGPIGLEFAWPLNPINSESDKYQIIFNIGQAF
jgi:outer membrane protein insertion porin family